MMNYYPFSIFLPWELYVFVFHLFEVDHEQLQMNEQLHTL